MKTYRMFAAATLISGTCWCIAVAAGEAQPAVTLAADGKPAAMIVLPDAANAQSAEQRAADLLVIHLKQMSGARLEIKRERDLGAVRVEGGRIILAAAANEPAVPDAELFGQESVPGESIPASRKPMSFVLIGQGELAKRLGVDASGVGVGGIRLKTAGNAVVLLGGPASMPGEPATDPDGVLYATLELLERLGCAYLWPGPVGKVVPHRATVAVEPLDVRYSPSIGRRYIRYSGWSERWDAGMKNLGLTKAQLDQWQAAKRARKNETVRDDIKAITWPAWQRDGGQMPGFGHAGFGLRDGDAQLKQHPEWFALQADGTRDQGGDARWCVCLSNPELIEHVANDIIEQVNKNPALTLVSLDANDGGSNTSQCLCDKCRALDPPDAPKIQMMTFGAPVAPGSRKRTQKVIECPALTDRVIWYSDRVAERVVKVHPNVKFGISCYSLWTTPPVREKIHPSLVCRWAPSELEGLKGWQQAGLRQVYWRPNILLFNRRDGKLKSFVGPIVEAMNEFAAAGIRQTDFDSINHWWATAGLSYYAAARLDWNPRMTVEEVIDDYARRGFGPAAKPIKQYWLRVEALSRKGVKIQHATAEDFIYTPQVTAELRAFLNAADAAAAGDAEIIARVAFLRLGLNYTELQETLDDMARRAREKDPSVDLAKARRLMDLDYLVLLDLMINYENMAVNVPLVAFGNGGFAKWASLPAPAAGISDKTLMERVHDPRYGQTGHEDSLEAMFKAFGLEALK